MGDDGAAQNKGAGGWTMRRDPLSDVKGLVTAVPWILAMSMERK